MSTRLGDGARKKPLGGRVGGREAEHRLKTSRGENPRRVPQARGGKGGNRRGSTVLNLRHLQEQDVFPFWKLLRARVLSVMRGN